MAFLLSRSARRLQKAKATPLRRLAGQRLKVNQWKGRKETEGKKALHVLNAGDERCFPAGGTPAERRNALRETSFSLSPSASLSLSHSLSPIMPLWCQARCATPRGLRGDACAHTDTAGFSAKRTWKGKRDAPPGRCSIDFIVLFFFFFGSLCLFHD